MFKNSKDLLFIIYHLFDFNCPLFFYFQLKSKSLTHLDKLESNNVIENATTAVSVQKFLLIVKSFTYFTKIFFKPNDKMRENQKIKKNLLISSNWQWAIRCEKIFLFKSKLKLISNNIFSFNFFLYVLWCIDYYAM